MSDPNYKIPPHVPAKFSGKTKKCIGTPQHKCGKDFPLKVGACNQLRCSSCNARMSAEHSANSRKARGIKEDTCKKSYKSLDTKQINSYYSYIENEDDECADIIPYRHFSVKKLNAE